MGFEPVIALRPWPPWRPHEPDDRYLQSAALPCPWAASSREAGVSSGCRRTLRETVSGQLFSRPVEQCGRCFQGGGGVLGAEHIGRQLIAKGIRIARGGRLR